MSSTIAPPAETCDRAYAALGRVHAAIDELQELDLAGVAEDDALLGLLAPIGAATANVNTTLLSKR